MKVFNLLLSVCFHYVHIVFNNILKYFVLGVNEIFHATFFMQCMLVIAFVSYMLIGKWVIWTYMVQSVCGKGHGTFTFIQGSFKKTR